MVYRAAGTMASLPRYLASSRHEIAHAETSAVVRTATREVNQLVPRALNHSASQ